MRSRNLSGFNLRSPNAILEPIECGSLDAWFSRELSQVSSPQEQLLLRNVAENLESFVRWPTEAFLLWPDCDRVPPSGARQKYFQYPNHIRHMARERGLRLDTRPNGPAIASFLLAGGDRPPRFGSSNAWSVHHLYSGKFPYIGRSETTHAARHGTHFTQSAGLIAVHPVADAMADEFPFFAWLLRGQAFLRFGYDPDAVFATEHDAFGFARGFACRIVHPGTGSSDC